MTSDRQGSRSLGGMQSRGRNHDARIRELEESLERVRESVDQPTSWVRPPAPVRLYRFTLAGDFAGESSQTAAIKRMDGSSVSAAEEVVNTLGLFDHLETDDSGVCALVRGVYHALMPTEGGAEGNDTTLTVVTFTLDADLAVGAAELAAATVTATSDEAVVAVSASITLTSHGQWRGQSGAAGMAILAGADWWIVYVEQRPARVLGELTGGLSIDDASQTLSSTVALDAWPTQDLPSPLTVHNPHKYHCIAGDECIAAWNEDEARYEIEEILPALAERFWFGLLAGQSWPLGLQQSADDTIVEATQVAVNSSGALPTGASLVIVDRYDLAHHASGSISTSPSDTGLAEYDPENDEYVVLEVTHRATHCLGTLAGGFSGTPATFGVSIAQDGCLNGAHPGFVEIGSATLSVQNRYGWVSGDDGAEIEIRRDPHTGDWYPVQGVVIAVEAIIDLRLNGTDLQYTKDGTTWTTWHTAGDSCP